MFDPRCEVVLGQGDVGMAAALMAQPGRRHVQPDASATAPITT
jgi:hypothetical protein